MVNVPISKAQRRWRRRGCLVKEDGYAVTLALVAMPLILGFALLVLDASRVVNLHTDLQNAVDAMAIAGARELDGRNDAISRAQTAVEDLAQNQAWFSSGGNGLNPGGPIPVVYDASDSAGSTVELIFLHSIPDSDDTPLLGAELDSRRTTDPNEAKYALVRVSPPQQVTTMFPLPVGGVDTLAVGAEAVAVYTAAACDVTPIYICNPFEGDGSGLSFNDHFANGDLYGREIVFQNTGAASSLPGNFGFLRTYGNGANVLAEALATGSPGVCYTADGVDTEPGANVGPVEQGINTRMGLYTGSYKGAASGSVYRPDKNSRIGQKMTGKPKDDCGDFVKEDDPGLAMGLPAGVGGTSLSSGGQITAPLTEKQLDQYWYISHGGQTTSPFESPFVPDEEGGYVLKEGETIPSAEFDGKSVIEEIRAKNHYPGATLPESFVPSRYDIYVYENENELADLIADPSPNTESGDKKMCHDSRTTLPERRRIFSAIINCVENEDILQGAATNVPVEAFTLMFLTRPAVTDGSTKEFRLEFTDITGKGGLGEIEDFFREESILVR